MKYEERNSSVHARFKHTGGEVTAETSLLFSGDLLSICASGSKMFVLTFQNNSLSSLHCGFFPIDKSRILSKHLLYSTYSWSL